MKKKSLKKIFRLSLQNLLILGGVFLCVFFVYASNQGKRGYKSVGSTSTVTLYTGSTSFNNDKVEERNTCFTVNNVCGKDLFIPTKTSAELLSFTGHAPVCTTLGSCTTECVLENFINGVYSGDITYSKIRNAISGFIDNTGIVTFPYGDNYTGGYGEWVSEVNVDTNSFGDRARIVNGKPIATHTYGGNYLYEFELYGLTPETKNINRGCFSDGSYWVNSNVYSRQTLKINYPDYWINNYTGIFVSLRFGGITGVNFGLVLDVNNDNGSDHSKYHRFNTFFGCRSELLPNPDKYCVERVIRTGAAPEVNPSAIYIKEFTNNYSFAGCGSGANCTGSRNTICSALTGLADTTFRALSTGDFGNDRIYNMMTPESTYSSSINGTTNNNYFYYRNTLGSQSGSRYSTQIFGFNLYNSDDDNYAYIPTAITNYAGLYMYDNNYYYYDTNEFPWQITTEKKHKSAIGFNTAQNGELAEVIIPLSQTNTYLSLYEIPVGSNDQFSSAISSTVGSMDVSAYKYICVSHACSAGYTKTATGCIDDGLSIPDSDL